jgi:hypothetical protein
MHATISQNAAGGPCNILTITDVLQVSTPAALLCALHGSEDAGSGLLEALLCPEVTFLLASSQPLLLSLGALHISHV